HPLDHTHRLSALQVLEALRGENAFGAALLNERVWCSVIDDCPKPWPERPGLRRGGPRFPRCPHYAFRPTRLANGQPSASEMSNRVRSRQPCPHSIWETTAWVQPMRSASSACVSPISQRAWLMLSPSRSSHSS